jgi:hypothetical protein
MDCEIYFRGEIYADEYLGDNLKTAVEFIKAVQEDDECEYKLPQTIAIRGHKPEFEDEWEDVVVSTLDI